MDNLFTQCASAEVDDLGSYWREQMKQFHQGRERLEKVEAELAKANQKIGELKGRLSEKAGALVEALDELAIREAEAEKKALEVYMEKAENMSAAEASTAGRNWAVTRGISIDKANVLRGKPSQIVERRSAEELWTKLKSLVPSAFIEGEAEEIEDAEQFEPRPEPLLW